MEISNQIRATEIHEKATAYYRTSEEFGYKFLMELKTIRDEKLFKELGYKDFGEYSEKNFDISRNTINERIQSADVWGANYNRALGSYGKTKARQIAQLPDSHRQEAIKKGIPTNEGTKPLEEATTREIEEYKKLLKEQTKELERSRYIE